MRVQSALHKIHSKLHMKGYIHKTAFTNVVCFRIKVKLRRLTVIDIAVVSCQCVKHCITHVDRSVCRPGKLLRASLSLAWKWIKIPVGLNTNKSTRLLN